MMLENDTIKLRAVEPTDLETLYKWENDSSVWAAGCTVSPYSRYNLKEYIKKSSKNIIESGELRLMIDCKSNNQTIGMADLFDCDMFHRRAGTGIFVAPEYRNHGFATQSMALLCDYALKFLHLHQIYAYVPEDNKPSIRMLTKCGFQQRGLIPDWLYSANSYTNVLIMSLLYGRAFARFNSTCL
ncbi:MAG: GNAT family N-acetyltransferase [Tannerella sp.]|jgi:diamine N-acetyltransferase|nr:GNAT family N-acetyltransferase [Tannerella sp.]